MKSALHTSLVATALVTTLPAGAAENTELQELRRQLSELEQRIEAVGAAADRSTTAPNRTTFGGYGELHYNNWDNQLPDGRDKKELDFHRFVLFFGHAFDERTRFFSELEVEHALVKDTQSGTKAPGEVELEQAYVEFDLNERMSTKGGVFLLPVGIINETHEPPTFYGVERNPVESQIIPATWWEGGAAFSHRLANGLAYDLAVHSGLYATGYDIRGGRQKTASAKADALAYTGRIKWTGLPGLELAASLNHQTDLTQGTATAIAGNLLTTHAIYSTGPFALRALYAQWRLDDNGMAAGRDEQQGWYVEPSYKLSSKWGVFARHSRWDKQAGDSADSEYTQTDVGVNYWPHPDVVIKLDYQDQAAPVGQNEYDGFNLGIGYQF